jgi:hypothetical protein
MLLAHGKKRTLLRATALPWGVLFFRLRRKTNTPHQNGEREGIWFPHTPASDTHWGCCPSTFLSGVFSATPKKHQRDNVSLHD